MARKLSLCRVRMGVVCLPETPERPLTSAVRLGARPDLTVIISSSGVPIKVIAVLLSLRATSPMARCSVRPHKPRRGSRAIQGLRRSFRRTSLGRPGTTGTCELSTTTSVWADLVDDLDVKFVLNRTEPIDVS